MTFLTSSMMAETDDAWTELPLFAPQGATIPNDTTTTDTAAMSALSHLIYDDDTPEEASELLRERGNRSFKLGKRYVTDSLSPLALLTQSAVINVR